MGSLGLFPPPPIRGQVTLGEIDGCLIASDTSMLDDTFLNPSAANMISGVPSFTILREHVRPTTSKESLKAAFLPGSDNSWKRAMAAWHEHGWYAAVQELAVTGSWSSTGVNFVGNMAKTIFAALRLIHRLSATMYPHKIFTTEETIKEFSGVPNWQNSLIRGIAWHPHTNKFAIALRDDLVKVYYSGQSIVTILKCRQQKEISDLSWRPLSASTLAIACGAGIVVWHLDPTSVVTRPSSTLCQWLTHPGHYPVSSVQWSPCGKFLLSSSPNDSSMIVWDPSKQCNVLLKNIGGGGVSFAKWSPDGMRIFASTPSNKFSVWETNNWKSEWWSAGINRCKAACWSPDGSILLTAIKGDTVVYSVFFENDVSDSVGGSKIAVPVIDLSSVMFDTGGGQVNVGGNVQSLVWDSSGKRLAISFCTKDSENEFIAVFCTRVKPVLQINPCGFIRGLPGETPQCICFQNNCENGAVLTSCWSSGRVSHIPFVFPKIGSPGAAGGNLSAFTSDHRYSTPGIYSRQPNLGQSFTYSYFHPTQTVQ